MNLLKQLYNKGLVQPPAHYVIDDLQYLAMMGSVAYGVSNDTSDVDVYGFCIPSHEILFPYEHGHILGFGKKPPNFEQWQQHHVIDKESRKEYDFTIYNIVKFFQLTMDCNPNMVDALFVPNRCVLYQTAIGKHVRDNRKLFLSKKAWHKFKGYAYSQLQKLKGKAIKQWVEFCDKYEFDPINTRPIDVKEVYGYESPEYEKAKKIYKQISQQGHISKRVETVVKYGYDVKFAYHLVRLLLEIEQILTECDLDLERSREVLKSIRRGEWSVDKVENFFNEKETSLEKLYHSTTCLPYNPQEDEIKKVLIECLEAHFGSLDKPFFKRLKVKEDLKGVISTLSKIVRELEK